MSKYNRICREYDENADLIIRIFEPEDHDAMLALNDNMRERAMSDLAAEYNANVSQESSTRAYCNVPHQCLNCGLHGNMCSCVATDYSIANAPWLINSFEPQSGMEKTTNDASIYKASTDISTQNVRFLDQNPSYAYDVDAAMDPTRKLQDSTDADLGNFFSRPIKIYEEEWGTGSVLGSDFDPWDLYFSNPRVINRIANFKLMRANLNVKVVINGNGFQYGRALLSYLPLSTFDELSPNSVLNSVELVQASQRPHIFLDPTTSTGGEMTLPFFWYDNYVDIVDNEWSQLGQMYLQSINPLKHANGATDKVTISVFAWASDLSVNVLTSRNPTGLTPQSGKEEIDEANNTGSISGPATAIAKMSNALAVIPPIAPFALATSEVATGVANMAKSLGYCRPPVTKNPEPFRSWPSSSLAVTNVPDTAQKLTVDDKQELTIDPRIAGLGNEDPMAIKEIAKRESYLTQFTWAIGEAPETLLWNARVDPVTWAEGSGSPTPYWFPACAMAALPFKHWTGSMTFRFQIVCSAFHKGRLKFVYDPDFLASNEYNTNYLEIVDIADTQDFSITVGNGQTRTLLDHHRPGFDSATQMYSTVAYTSQEEGNGVLGVYIVNELTTPNSTADNDIEINVYVSMGEDFEVFVPDKNFGKYVFKPQSGLESEGMAPDSFNTAEPSAPQLSMTDKLGPDTQNNALINMVFTGESINSFRQMLKRYSRHESIYYGIPVSGEMVRYSGSRNMFPYFRGNVPSAVHETGAGAPYNYCNTLLLHWVVSAFQGWRGSIRRKVHLVGNNQDIEVGTNGTYTTTMWIQREPALTTDATYRETSGNEVAPVSFDNGFERAVLNDDPLFGTLASRQTGHNGYTFADSGVNPVAEFESPFYSFTRFFPGKRANYTDDNFVSEGYTVFIKGPRSDTSYADVHVAIGEDFQTYFWTGLPPVYYENAPPTSVPPPP